MSDTDHIDELLNTLNAAANDVMVGTPAHLKPAVEPRKAVGQTWEEVQAEMAALAADSEPQTLSEHIEHVKDILEDLGITDVQIFTFQQFMDMEDDFNDDPALD